MGTIFKEIKNFVKPSSGVFVEIGSERGEGSTHELDRLAKLHGTKLISVDISDSAKNRYQTQLPDVEFVVAPGSAWAREFGSMPTDIACLYLDNFDYIWDINDIRPAIQRQMEEYNSRGQVMSNQACQTEHMAQILALRGCLNRHSTIVMDDTYCINDCWIGKCGPVVVYLKAQGWQVVHQTLDCGVIMQYPLEIKL